MRIREPLKTLADHLNPTKDLDRIRFRYDTDEIFEPKNLRTFTAATADRLAPFVKPTARGAIAGGLIGEGLGYLLGDGHPQWGIMGASVGTLAGVTYFGHRYLARVARS